jgi:hypothetical protein
MTIERSWSGAPGGDAQPVAVRVYDIALASGEAFFIDRDPELLGHSVDVVDIEVDQGLRRSVALVLRQVKADVPACHRDEPRKPGLELMLPLFDEPEPPIPSNSTRRVLDIENRHDLLVHRDNANEQAATGEARGRD